MLFISQHPIVLLVFFTVPVVGYFLYLKLPRKAITSALYIAIVLLIPIAFGYFYIVNFTGSVLLYIALTCGYALYAAEKGYWLNKSLVQTAILFFILGTISFFAMMMGDITVKGEWDFKGYKMQYVRQRGFSGAPVFTYELSRYAKIPIFIKHVDTQVAIADVNKCEVIFVKEHFTFDKCQSDQGAGKPSITVDSAKK